MSGYTLKLNSFKISSQHLIFCVSLLLVVFYNGNFFSAVAKTYPLTFGNGARMISVAIVFVFFLQLLFSLFNNRFLLKPVLIGAVMVAAAIRYYSGSYDVIIDVTMVQNILETDSSEAFDLINSGLLLSLLVWGVLPALLIGLVRVEHYPLRAALKRNLVNMGIAVLVIAVCMLSFGRFYASFLRQHKTLRYHTNPTYAIYSVGQYVGRQFKSSRKPLKHIGLDAHQLPPNGKRRLAIVVVGEAVRADHLQRNGYARETTPLLDQEATYNFPNMYSCGTSTAVSVPCMFSIYDRRDYTDSKGKNTENVMDVLNRAGVAVLWRDNNSSSKGVANRIPNENFKTPDNNPVCEGECRDEGMLSGLQDYIDQHASQDILIVLHQMGNHGPAYFKRYPAEYEKFTPVCNSNQLEQCSQDEIINTYDNALLYTDYFLDQVIALLKSNDGRFKSSMLYISDHGESLGDNGLYLHGMPYLIAPDEQKHVAATLWLGDSFKQDIATDKLMAVSAEQLSHDNLFHSLLGLMRVRTEVYQQDKDIFADLAKTQDIAHNRTE